MLILKGGKPLFSKFWEGFYSLLMRKTFNVIRRRMKLSSKKKKKKKGDFDIYFQKHADLC